MRSTLCSNELPPHVVFIWIVYITSYSVYISNEYPFKSGSDVLNQLRHMFQDSLYAWDPRAMGSLSAPESALALIQYFSIDDVIEVKETEVKTRGQEVHVNRL